MTEQIQSLPPTLLGACYNNLISHEKSKQIQELVKVGEVKILFITIERIINDQKFEIPTPDFVIFDEPHQCYEISSNYKLTHKNFNTILKRRFKSIPILALVPQVTTEEALGICHKFDIPAENIYPLEVCHYSRPHLTVSRDEDPAKAIVALLNNVKFTERFPVIIYVEGRKTAEELSENLIQNGIASQIFLASKPEIQKIQIIGNFTKQNPPFLIVPSGMDLGIDRSLVKRVIHYNLPKSTEILAQEILCLGEDAHCHVFLSDDDYYKARVSIFADSFEKLQINKFVEKILDTKNRTLEEKNNNESGTLTGNKRRRDGTEVNSNADSTLLRIMGTELNPFLSRVLQQKSDPGQDYSQEIYSTKVSEMIRYLNLRKDQMIIIFESLEATGGWLKFLGINPLVCSIQINPNKGVNFEHNPIIQHLAKKSKRSRIQIPDLSSELNSTVGETLRGLRVLQSEGVIKMEIIEEVLNFKIMSDPDARKVSEQIDLISAQLMRKSELAFCKLDAVFAAARLISLKNLEYVFRQNKLDILKKGKNGTNMQFNSNNTSLSSTICFENEISCSLQSSDRFNILQWIDKYLNTTDSSKGYQMLFSDPNEIRTQLPLVWSSTQREKSTLYADLNEFLGEYIDMLVTEDSAFLDPRAYETELIKTRIAGHMVRIGMGIPCFDLNKDWKSSKFWGRFYRYDPSDIYTTVNEILQMFDYNSKIQKKFK